MANKWSPTNHPVSKTLHRANFKQTIRTRWHHASSSFLRTFTILNRSEWRVKSMRPKAARTKPSISTFASQPRRCAQMQIRFLTLIWWTKTTHACIWVDKMPIIKKCIQSMNSIRNTALKWYSQMALNAPQRRNTSWPFKSIVMRAPVRLSGTSTSNHIWTMPAHLE